jgi:hypothetical protein
MTPILEALVVGIAIFFAFNLWLILLPYMLLNASPKRGELVILELCAVITGITVGWLALPPM